MKRAIKFEHTPDGFIFSLNGTHIAISAYGDEGLTLIENDNNITTHASGFVAMSYLKEKYLNENSINVRRSP